jgi:hypothetical protein
MRQLSSSLSAAAKWGPPAFVVLFASVAVGITISGGAWRGSDGQPVSAWKPLVGIACMLIVAGLGPWWFLSRDLRTVSTDGEHLYVGKGPHEVAIPLRQVGRVWDSGFGVERVSIEFIADTPVGRRVHFVPLQRLWAGWSEPPVVAELLALVEANGGSASRAAA